MKVQHIPKYNKTMVQWYNTDKSWQQIQHKANSDISTMPIPAINILQQNNIYTLKKGYMDFFIRHLCHCHLIINTVVMKVIFHSQKCKLNGVEIRRVWWKELILHLYSPHVRYYQWRKFRHTVSEWDPISLDVYKFSSYPWQSQSLVLNTDSCCPRGVQ